ncbi:MAG: isochorismatase family protein [Candidatus Aminicenantes bacterium]|nr:MAG: isochorismatase family protein [Candidatus Aminicenantes bacterium]
MSKIDDIIRQFTAHQWAPEVGRTAVLLIDLQEYFRGIINPILENIVSLVSAAREKNIPLFFTQHSHDPGADNGMLGRWWSDLIIKGSNDSRLIPELNVEKGECVIHKNTYSAFHQTDLEKKFKDLGVTDLVIGGVMTNLCCETTARDAFVRNFRVFFLADGTSTISEEFHLATLKNLGYGFAILMSCDRFIQTIAANQH